MEIKKLINTRAIRAINDANGANIMVRKTDIIPKTKIILIKGTIIKLDSIAI
jgi:hypothetical protein